MRIPSSMSAAAPARAGSRKRLRAVVWRTLGLIFVCLAIAVLIPSNGYLGAARTDYVIQQAIDGRGFRLAAWETQAIAQKVRDLVTRPGANLTSDEQHDLVVAYFDALGRIDKLVGDIERLYADPKGADPVTLAAPLQAELNDLRAAQAERRPAVERIIEGQVAAVLDEAGLTTGGQVWPPGTVCVHRKPRLPHRLAAGSHRCEEGGLPRPRHFGCGYGADRGAGGARVWTSARWWTARAAFHPTRRWWWRIPTSPGCWIRWPTSGRTPISICGRWAGTTGAAAACAPSTRRLRRSSATRSAGG